MVSFKEAAYRILNKSEEPLSTKEITDLAIEEGLIDTIGKTPEATMGAQIYTDILKNKNTLFIKVGKGLFSLKNKDSVSSSLILIEKQNDKVRKALKDRLHNMDPNHFEYLISDLLKKIGYENVEVTKRSNDGGIDITCELTMGGLTNVKTAIQVKRFKNKVTNKIIAQLRGHSQFNQRGLVITTSDFTPNAIKEAKDVNKLSVSLVNGNKLLDLMFKYEVGVKKEEKIIYSLDTDYFESEDSTLKKAISSNKNRSTWPLPGGINNYINTLNNFLEILSSGFDTKKKLISWYMKNFNVNSETTAYGYIHVPKNMGLIDIKNGKYFLTEDGKKYLKSKDLSLLYETISKNIFAFDEILEFLKTSKEPKNEQDILNYLNENFDAKWESFAQTTFRLNWLLNLNKIKKTDEGYLIK